MLAAVDGAKYTSLLLWASSAAEGAGKNDVWTRGMNDDAADSPGFLQPHVGPGLADISRLINSVAHHVTVTDDPGFTGSRPDHAWIGRGNGERADGSGGLLVKDGHPSIASIDRFPNAAGCRTGIVRARISRDACNGCDAIPHFGTDKAESKLAFLLIVRLLCVSRHRARKDQDQSEIIFSAAIWSHGKTSGQVRFLTLLKSQNEFLRRSPHPIIRRPANRCLYHGH